MTVTDPDDRVLPVDTRLDAWLLTDDDLAAATRTAAEKSTDEQRNRAWTSLRRIAQGRLEEQVVEELRRALPDRLVDLLVGGLADYESVRDAARASLTDPTARPEVVLADRTLHARRPVDIHVTAGVLRTTLPFVARLDFHVVAARAQLADGRLTAVTLADPTVVGTVTAYGGTIASRTGVLRVGRGVDVRPPHRILSEQEERDLRAGRPT